MKIIQFKENQKEIWNKFIAENNSESFLQSWEWGEFNRALGRKVRRIGIVENNLLSENKTIKSQIQNHKFSAQGGPALGWQIPNSKYDLLAVALIVKHDLPFGRSYLYCPRGPVVAESRIKNQESRIPNILFDEIKKIAKEERSLFLKIDPPIGMNYESGITNCEYSNNFRTSSFCHFEPVRVRNLKNILCKNNIYIKTIFRSLSRCGSFEMTGSEEVLKLKKSPSEIQPRDTLILDITKSEEELLKEMKQKARYNIRLAGKKELRIKSYELRTDNEKFFKEKFEEFWKLIKETSRRDKFSSHSKNYYWQMLENLDGHEGDIRECRLRAKLYFAEYDKKIIVANIVLYFGDMAVYLHGASSNKYRNLMAPYLLQWQQIIDAKKAGCKKYDFWGIAPKSQIQNYKSQINSKFKIQNSKFNTWSGITKFKKGFGGEEKNYIGAYELVFDSIGYRIYGFVKFVKLKVFHFLSSRRSRND